MADLDTLQIHIKGENDEAIKAIDQLIARLRNLNKNLALGNANVITRQLQSISRAVAGIDVSKINAATRAIDGLLKASTRSAGFDYLGNQAKSAKTEIAAFAKELGAMTGITSKSGLAEIQTRLENIAELAKAGYTVKDGNAINRAFENEYKGLDEFIRENSKVRESIGELRDQYAEVRDYIKAHPIRFDENAGSWEEQFGNIAAVGLGNVSKTKGTTIDEWVSYLPDQLSYLRDKLEGSNDALADLAQWLKTAGAAAKQAEQPLARISDSFASTIKNDVAIWAEKQGYAAGDAIKAQKAIDDATVGKTIATLAEPLKQLEGIVIPDFSGMIPLAEGIKELSKVNADKAAKILIALQGLGGLQNINLANSGIAEAAQGIAAIASVKDIGTIKNLIGEQMAATSKDVADNVDRVASKLDSMTHTSMGTDRVGKLDDGLADMAKTADAASKSVAELFREQKELNKARREFKAGKGDQSDEYYMDIVARLKEVNDAIKAIETEAIEMSQQLESGMEIAEGSVAELYQKQKELTAAMKDFKAGKGDDLSDSYYVNLLTQIKEIDSAIKEVNKLDVAPKENPILFSANDFKNAKVGIDAFANSIIRLEGEAYKAEQEIRGLETEAERLANVQQDPMSAFIGQTLADIREYRKELSTMQSKPELFDRELFVGYSRELSEATRRWEEFQRQVQQEIRPVGGLDETSQKIQHLIDEANQLNETLNGMRSGKIGIDYSLYNQMRDRLEDVNAELDKYIGKQKEKKDAEEKSKDSSLHLLATLVALGHELSHVAAFLGELGDKGINALKWLYKPIQLATQEYREKLSDMAKFFENFYKRARQSLNKLAAFWKRSMKTFTFMLVRKAITAVITEISDAVTSLAKWSKLFGTSFNDSISHITSNFSYMARSILGAFEPLINWLVPMMNALADAFVNVTARIGEFFAAVTGQGYYMKAKKQLVDYTEAQEKASKAQKNLIAGLDDLNIITSPTATESGMDDVAEQWEKVDVSDKMKDFADAVKKIAKDLFDPIKKAWDKVGDHVKDQFKFMFKNLKQLFKDIARDWMEVWQQEATQKILERIFEIIGNIVEGIGWIALRFDEAWNKGKTGLHILENIRDITGIIVEHIYNMSKAFVEFAKNLDFSPLLEAFEEFTRKIQPFVDFIFGLIEDYWERVILRHWKWMIEEGLPHLLHTIGNILAAFDFDKIRRDLQPVMDAFETMRENIETGIVNAIGKLGERVAKFANSEDFTNFTKNVAWFMEQINAERVEKLFEGLGTAILNLAEALMKFVGSEKFKDFMTKLFEWYDRLTVDDIADFITRIAEAILLFKFAQFAGKGLEMFFKFVTVIEGLSKLGGISGILTVSGASLTGLATAAGILVAVAAAAYSLIESFGGLDGLLDELGKHFKIIKNGIKDAFEKSGLKDKIDKLKESFEKLLKTLGSQKSLWQTLFTLIDGLVVLIANVAIPVIETWVEILTAFTEVITGVLDLVGGLFDILKGFFTGDSKLISEGWDRMCEGFKSSFKGVFDFIVGIGGIVPKLVQGIVNFFKWLKNQLLGDPIVIDICEGIIGWFGKMVDGVVKFVKGLVKDVVKFFSDLAAKVIGKVKQLAKDALARWKEIKEGICEWAEKTRDALFKTWERVKEEASKAWDAFKATAKQKWEAIKTAIHNIAESLRKALFSKWEEVKKNASDAWAAVKTTAETMWNNIKTAIHNVAESIRSGLESKWQEVKQNAETWWKNIKESAQSWWDNINSTIRGAMENLANDFDGIWSDIKSRAEGWWDSICQSADSWWDTVNSTIRGAMQNLPNDFDNLWGDIKSRAEGWWNSIASSIGNIASGIGSSVQSAINGASNAIGNLGSDLADKASEIKNAATDLIGNVTQGLSTATQSTSTTAKKNAEALVNSAKGIINTITTKISKVANSGKTMAASTIESLYSLLDKAEEAIKNLGNRAGNTTEANEIVKSGFTTTRTLKQMIENARRGGSNIGSSALQGLAQAFKTGGSSLLNQLGKFTDMMVDTVEGKLKINSPSKVFMGIGENIVEGLNDGLKDNENSTVGIVGSWMDKIANVDVPDFDAKLPDFEKKIDLGGNFNGQLALDDATIRADVQQGVAEAIGGLILPYLNDIAQSSRTTANKQFGISSRQAFTAVQDEARAYTMRTGKTAFA